MILMRGNMWDSPHGVKLFTGNSTVKVDGRLVMGRGAALEAKTLFPNCDMAFGSLITGFKRFNNNKPYGVLFHPDRHDPVLGVFQVKDLWCIPAKIELIVSSVDILNRIAREDWKYSQVDLNFPGIGNGCLLREDVLPLLKRLPKNVHIWERS